MLSGEATLTATDRSLNMNLTRHDIELLVREPSAAMRSRIAQKIAVGYVSGSFNETELGLANEIFRLLLKDTEIRVRKLLAEELKHSMQVPHDIIWKLAHDHADVAVPVLQHSFVLTEEDLVAIIDATREHPKLCAIAARDSLSKEVGQKLIESGDVRVVRAVVSNRNALLNDTAIEQILASFGRESSILEELASRGGLKPEFAERLFHLVSDALKKHLTKKYRLGRHVLDDVVTNAKETAVLQFIAPWMSQTDISQLVDQMHRNKRLSDSVIVRSLCIGDLRFFEAAIAKRVGIPAANARILMMDPGALGFRSLYASAHLPASFYEALTIMVKFALKETEYGRYRDANFARRMSEHIHAHGFHKTVANMDVMLTMIGRAFDERPTLH